jgi:hypothetical protein
MKKGHKLSNVFGFLYDPKIPLLFLLGAFIMAVGGNAAYSLVLELTGGATSKNYLRILIGSIVTLGLIVGVVKIMLTKFLKQGFVGESKAFKVHRKGLIYTAGKQVDTIALSLEKQTPSFIGFLCSKASEPYIDELVRTMGFEEDKYNKKIVDPQNIDEIRLEIKLIIDWMLAKGLKSSDMVVDVTGGMTTMSVGAYSMADEMKVDTQYIKSEFDDRNKPIKNTQEGVFVKRYTDVG